MSEFAPSPVGSVQQEPPRAADAAAPRKPVIGITMGDPAGIGAEVIVKALAVEAVRHSARFVLYGMEEALADAADQLEVNPFWYRMPHDAPRRIERGVVLADFDEFSLSRIGSTRGPSQEGGAASGKFVEEAIDDARRHVLDAIVTAPVSKTSWKMAGVNYPGHTELFAHRFRSNRVAMMFVGGPLRVALASIHEPLFEVCRNFTLGRVFQPIDLLNDALRNWFGIAAPRIGVAGLNPHASEGGLFGDEESRVIEPAISMAREHGINVSGPFPADTIFCRAADGEFDGVVAMYHDQGLIPIKLLAFHSAVNVSLGLPIIRTSVDHGTAFDIAGRGRANPGSMAAAINLAVRLHATSRSAVNSK